MLLFRTHDNTGNSSGIVLKEIIVTFTVVPALHKVVYLLWPSTFKVKVTRDSKNSKNICHGIYMVNSKSNMFSKDVTLLMLLNSPVFSLSIIVYYFTMKTLAAEYHTRLDSSR